MEKALLQKAKAPMIALINLKNTVETKMKRVFVLLLLLSSMAPMAVQAQGFGNQSKAFDECKKPTQLTVSQITTNSAELSWVENGEATAWYIMLNEDYDHLVYADVKPFTLTELTPETEYSVKVRPFCEEVKWNNEIFFTTLEACPTPENLQAANLSATTATLSWTGFGESYIVQYRPSIVRGQRGATVGGEWLTYYTTEPSLMLTGLVPETTYEVRVQGDCGDDGYSEWSEIITFTTLDACSAPTGLQVDNLTATTATLSWTGFSQDYEVRYRAFVYKGGRGATVGGEWETCSTTESSVTLTDLTPETTYEVQVQGDCGDDGYSDWSAIIMFTTELFAGGGSEDDPFIIATTDDMDALAAKVTDGNDYSGKFFRLDADLDYSEKTYTPVGNGDIYFCGSFDGNEHTISHVNLAGGASYIGVFGVLGSGSTVKNLTLDESSIIGENVVGGIAGGAVNSIISNCQNKGSVKGSYHFGGIVGHVINTTISNCQNSGSVVDDDGNCVGGIAGYVSNNVIISNCQNMGYVQGYNYVGCIAGEVVNSTIIDCQNLANYQGDSYVGGIAGYVTNCTVSNCLNLGWVDYYHWYHGGIAGYADGTTFTNNYYYNGSINGGINGSDVTGQAMRGYTIEAYAPLVISLESSIGLAFEGKVYAGNGQSVVVSLDIPNSSNTPQCYTLNAGTLVDNGNDTFTIAMPASNITISGNIVEFYGTYYEIPCDGGTTATVIYDDSYLTLGRVDIEDFEYLGTQYAVTAIASGAFDGCDSIVYFDCHSNISTIGDHAIRNCTGITSFGFYHTHTPPTLGEGVFEGLNLDTLWLMVPFCSQYDYKNHPVWGQFGIVFPDGECEYNFTNQGGDKLWSNPENWAENEVPGAGAQVGIQTDCVIDTDVTVGSVTIGYYYDEYYGLYERLTVKDGATLNATNFIYTTGGPENFVIEDGAQVYHPNAGAKATLEKNITAYTVGQTQGDSKTDGWHLIGYSFAENGAVTDMTNLLGNEYDLYYYDEPTYYWRNQKKAANNFTEFEAAKGYLYANSAAIDLGLTGTLNAANATVNLPLSYTASAGNQKGFNLVGNPFAHNVTGFAGSNVASEVYRMNGTKDDLMVSEISATNPLLPGEGFFVKATGDDASITFNSSAKGENVKRGHIALEISENGKLIDRFILKQDGEPLEKLTLNENGTKIFATRDQHDWAVVPMQGNEQHINFKAAKNGTYTLTFDMENVNFNYLHLIDNMTGADVDLLATNGGDATHCVSTYTFEAKTIDYASRFRLVFNPNDAEVDNNASFAFINNGQIIITADVDEATLQVVDMLGHVIYQGDAKHCVSTNGMATGVYVLRLIEGDNVRTQKIVIE